MSACPPTPHDVVPYPSTEWPPASPRGFVGRRDDACPPAHAGGSLEKPCAARSPACRRRASLGTLGRAPLSPGGAGTAPPPGSGERATPPRSGPWAHATGSERSGIAPNRTHPAWNAPPRSGPSESRRKPRTTPLQTGHEDFFWSMFALAALEGAPGGPQRRTCASDCQDSREGWQSVRGYWQPSRENSRAAREHWRSARRECRPARKDRQSAWQGRGPSPEPRRSARGNG